VEVHEATGIDPWFLDQIQRINAIAQAVSTAGHSARHVPCCGARQAARLSATPSSPSSPGSRARSVVRGVRHALGIRPVYKTVDTCAAEFAARTPYHYSSYDETRPRSPPGSAGKVIILGQRPNRIGQGVEFDYSCVHAVSTLRDAGYETVMVNCNPETVSTDYDTSDRLYFEPLTLEDVLEVVHAELAAGTRWPG
jgi:carbamoyl-phosphate synthase large subunit